MNILDQQDKLKGLSEQQLVSEMQMPSGQMPQYLVLSEITRRKSMRDEMAAREQQGPQSTVAEEAVAAAGMPQQGLGRMAMAMAPQSDIVGNSGIGALPQAPQGMPQAQQGAAPVQRMQEGGFVSDEPPMPWFRDPAVQAQAARMGLRPSQIWAQMSDEARRSELARIEMQGNSVTGPVTRQDFISSIIPPTGGGVNPSYSESASRPDPFADPVPPAPPPQVTGPMVPPRNLPGLPPVAMSGPLIPPNLDVPFAPVDLDLTGGQRPAQLNVGATELNTPAIRTALGAGGGGAGLATGLRAIANDRQVQDGTNLVGATELNTPAVRTALQQSARVSDLPLELSGLPSSMTEAAPRSVIPAPRTPSEAPSEPAADPAAVDPAADPAAAPTVGGPAGIPAGAGSGGGSGGGSAPAGTGGMSSYEQELTDAITRSEERAEQDKWLALAQAGMALMSSTQPTLGGALGEAGATGLAAFRGSRDDAEESRIGLMEQRFGAQLAQQQLAMAQARAAGGGGSGGGVGGFRSMDQYFDNLTSASAMLGEQISGMVGIDGMPNPATIDQYEAMVAQQSEIDRQRMSILGLNAGGGSAPALAFDAAG